MSTKDPFREYARYWLAGDDLQAGRSNNFTTREIRAELAEQIEALYAAAAGREDVEDIELEHMDVTYKTPYVSGASAPPGFQLEIGVKAQGSS